MSNYNKLLLMGNITNEPELSYTPSQTAVVEFGIAVNRKWTSKSGEKKEETCFIDCRAFAKTAETINKHCHKGSPIFLEGRLTFDSWQAQDGSKRSKHRMTVDNFQFIGAPQSKPEPKPEPEAGSSRGFYQPTHGQPESSSFGGAMDDDIPF